MVRTQEYLRRYAYVYCYILSLFLLLAGIIRQHYETVSSLQETRISPKIIIDPGHGGMDGGASTHDVLEKDLNLEISLRLESLLRLLGQDPAMTRREDMDLATEGQSIRERKRSDLKNRVALANEQEGTFLVSIHQNHFSDGQYSGIQVFYADTVSSQTVAQRLQERLNQALDSKRRCKKAQGVYLMEHLEGSGILVECGFLSNPQEAELLQQADYQKKLCCILAGSLMTDLADWGVSS